MTQEPWGSLILILLGLVFAYGALKRPSSRSQAEELPLRGLVIGIRVESECLITAGDLTRSLAQAFEARGARFAGTEFKFFKRPDYILSIRVEQTKNISQRLYEGSDKPRKIKGKLYHLGVELKDGWRECFASGNFAACMWEETKTLPVNSVVERVMEEVQFIKQGYSWAVKYGGILRPSGVIFT